MSALRPSFAEYLTDSGLTLDELTKEEKFEWRKQYETHLATLASTGMLFIVSIAFM